jgi:hypothetical protein
MEWSKQNEEVFCGGGKNGRAGSGRAGDGGGSGRAQLNQGAAAYVVAIYDWSGFYIGANGGWGQANESGSLVPGGFNLGSHKVSGAVAGGQIGYRWQARTWVFGVEA